MRLDPFSDALYVFCNRYRDRLKVLYWDQTGFCLWYKRLEKAKFKWPRKHADEVAVKPHSRQRRGRPALPLAETVDDIDALLPDAFKGGVS